VAELLATPESLADRDERLCIASTPALGAGVEATGDDFLVLDE